MTTQNISSVAQAETITSRHHPNAIDWKSVFDGNQRIGWTYDNGQGGYSWINRDGATSQRMHLDRDAAHNDSLTTHRSTP